MSGNMKKNYYQINKSKKKFENYLKISTDKELDSGEQLIEHEFPEQNSNIHVLESQSELDFNSVEIIKGNRCNSLEVSIVSKVDELSELSVLSEANEISETGVLSETDILETNEGTSYDRLLESFEDVSLVSSPVVDEILLVDKLKNWYLQHNITLSGFKSLLTILHDYYPDLPRDPRTIMKPSTPANIVSHESGDYVYLGIEEGILKMNQDHLQSLSIIVIKIFIDGFNTFKSVKNGFWPIIGSIENSQPCYQIIQVGWIISIKTL